MAVAKAVQIVKYRFLVLENLASEYTIVGQENVNCNEIDLLLVVIIIGP